MLKQNKQNKNSNTNLVPYSNIGATTIIGLNLNNNVEKKHCSHVTLVR